MLYTEKQWRKRNGGNVQPKVRNIKKSGRRHRLKGRVPGEFIVIYSLIITMTVAVVAWLLIDSYRPTQKKELVYVEGNIASVKIGGFRTTSLIELNNTEELFHWPEGSIIADEEPAVIERLRTSGEKFCLGLDAKGKDGSGYRRIETILDANGKELIPSEVVERSVRKNQVISAAILFGLLLINVFGFVTTIRIFRDPKRFRPWYRRLFVRDSALDL